MKYKITYNLKALDETMIPLAEPDVIEDDEPTEQSRVYDFYEEHPKYNLYAANRTRYESTMEEYSFEYKYGIHKYEVIVNFTDHEINKYAEVGLAEFFNDELEFFDKLGFTTMPSHQRGFSQRIEDWWGK